MSNNQSVNTQVAEPRGNYRQFRLRIPFPRLSDNSWKWILLLPAVITVVVLLLGPILWTLVAAFTDMHLYRPPNIETQFIGLRNFEKLLHNGSFWRTVRNTVVFMAGVVPIQLTLGLLLAVCLNNVMRGRKFFRTWFLLPMMLSPVVSSFIAGRMMFQEDIGPINFFLKSLGVATIPWLTDANWAMVTLIIVDVWQWSSFMFLMLMAGLQGVPHELLEAARVDGATHWQGFRFITIPIIMPVTVTALLIRVIDAFRVVDIVMTLTGGGPGQATETVSIAIFRTGVKGGDLAFGSSQAYFLVVILLVFGGGFLYISRRAINRNQE
ncbi:MAG: sugar ABC transporter permease [Anaerolineae bacterium]|nr:sugar ABC transporter permease [Anaerolineae bacterium]